MTYSEQDSKQDSQQASEQQNKKSVSRRSLLKGLGAATALSPLVGVQALAARPGSPSTPFSNLTEQPLAGQSVAGDQKQTEPPSESLAISDGKQILPGYLSVIQGPTSDTETHINILVPKLKNYLIEVTSATGEVIRTAEPTRIQGPGHMHVMKIKISGLRPNIRYTLDIFDRRSSSNGKATKGIRVDQRFFQTLDFSKRSPRFAVASCMADEFRFDSFIPRIWKKLESQNVDFLVLTGDIVYVDSKEFVERQKATEFDIWQRYTDAMRKIPLYHWINLKPIFATWDDHDYGTNDGDRNFVGREPAQKLFHALFFGEEIPGVWEPGPAGTSAVFSAYGQRFFMMDDRSFRQPASESEKSPELYGHWGAEQHRWLLSKLQESNQPAWIVNGNQIFRGAPDDVTFVESMQYNHPKHLEQLKSDLKRIEAPVVFTSGDVHLSEVMSVSESEVGYQTYEFTSSSMHSFLGGEPWKNVRRLDGKLCAEFNFCVFQTLAFEVKGRSALRIGLECMGTSPENYFTGTFEVVR